MQYCTAHLQLIIKYNKANLTEEYASMLIFLFHPVYKYSYGFMCKEPDEDVCQVV